MPNRQYYVTKIMPVMLKFYHTEGSNWLTDLTLNVFQRGAIQAHHSTEVLGKHCIRTLETFKQTNKKSESFPFPGNGGGVFSPIPPAKYH